MMIFAVLLIGSVYARELDGCTRIIPCNRFFDYQYVFQRSHLPDRDCVQLFRIFMSRYSLYVRIFKPTWCDNAYMYVLFPISTYTNAISSHETRKSFQNGGYHVIVQPCTQSRMHDYRSSYNISVTSQHARPKTNARHVMRRRQATHATAYIDDNQSMSRHAIPRTHACHGRTIGSLRHDMQCRKSSYDAVAHLCSMLFHAK